jgi:hypothetical protein
VLCPVLLYGLQCFYLKANKTQSKLLESGGSVPI